MDARSRRVAVAPIVDVGDHFSGREYLGLYPYLDRTGTNFYIHKSENVWVSLSRWLSGADPTLHS